ncbi:MAG: hypothetical protein RL141_127 [Candidatus Parcubacteria bacterium]|jgi:uncharacterized membrane protein (UPF0127 family)
MKALHLVIILLALIVGAALTLRFLPASALPSLGEKTAQPPLQERRVLLVDERVRIPVEVARANEEHARGLSYRTTLPATDGMLFVFPVAESRSFWMRGMQFPLDILFIREGRIISIHPSVPPPSETKGIPAIVRSPAAADMVLEVNAGAAEAWELVVGMEVTMEQK